MIRKKKRNECYFVMGENRQEKEKDKHTEQYRSNLESDLAEMDRNF